VINKNCSGKLKVGIDLTVYCNDITVSERRYMI